MEIKELIVRMSSRGSRSPVYVYIGRCDRDRSRGAVVKSVGVVWGGGAVEKGNEKF